jgi:RNA ligase (TIGR02306 family)
MKIVKIKSIKEIKNTSLLYDIEVDKNHCFFANNILVHNSSAAFVLKNNEFNVCSRSLNLRDGENNSFWRVAHKYDIEEKMREFGPKYGLVNWSIQGELVGEGVQGNIYKLKGHMVAFYNAFNIDTQEYIEYDKFIEIIKDMGLEICPVIFDDYELPDTIDQLFALVDNFKTIYGNTKGQILAEGWVFVAKGTVLGERIERSSFNRLSFKAKSRTYDMSKKK